VEALPSKALFEMTNVLSFVMLTLKLNMGLKPLNTGLVQAMKRLMLVRLTTARLVGAPGGTGGAKEEGTKKQNIRAAYMYMTNKVASLAI